MPGVEEDQLAEVDWKEEKYWPYTDWLLLPLYLQKSDRWYRIVSSRPLQMLKSLDKMIKSEYLHIFIENFPDLVSVIY